MIEIQYSSTALLLPHQNNGTAHPSYINYYLKSRRFVARYVQPLIINKYFYNQSSSYENYRQFLLQMEHIGRPMKNTMYVQWYGKKHLSG